MSDISESVVSYNQAEREAVMTDVSRDRHDASLVLCIENLSRQLWPVPLRGTQTVTKRTRRTHHAAQWHTPMLCTHCAAAADRKKSSNGNAP